MNDTVEKDRSPPESERVSLATRLVPLSTFTWKSEHLLVTTTSARRFKKSNTPRLAKLKDKYYHDQKVIKETKNKIKQTQTTLVHLACVWEF